MKKKRINLPTSDSHLGGGSLESKKKTLGGTEKKILIVSSIAVLLTFIIGASYAYIAYTTRQKGINVLETDCINVTMEELTNEIRLKNAYPITDEVGSNLKPFRFKLTNTCGVGVDYNLNLEVMETENRINAKNIAVKVDENAKSILNNNPSATPTYKESDYTAVESYTTYSGSIKPYDSVTHEVRIWLDASAGNDSQNGSFYSKVVIEARQNQVVYNQDLIKLAKIIETEPKYMDEFLETTEDVDKIVASNEAMVLIISSDYLKEELKNSENYTDEIRNKILNTTVVSEGTKYSAGLPCYIYGVNDNVLGGYTNKLYYSDSRATVSSSFNNEHRGVAYRGSYYVYTSVEQINLDDYNYLQLTHNHSTNNTKLTGTTTLGLYTDTNNDTNFTISKSDTWASEQATSTILLDISGYNGNYYIKGITKHNGQVSVYTVSEDWNSIALY